MRVPFIAAWAKPNAENEFQKRYPIAENVVRNQMGTIMDIYPTILSVADMPLPRGHELEGEDLKRMLEGKPDKHHCDDFLMHFPHAHRGSYFTTYRKGDWKLIYYYHPKDYQRPTMKLYNLKDDSFENTDMSQWQPKILKMMFERMN